MKIEALGAGGRKAGDDYSLSYYLDDTLLLDGGGIGHASPQSSERPLSRILVTHAHFDHIKGIPLLLDSALCSLPRNGVNIVSTREIISDLRRHVFNNRIWPDFSEIPDGDHPILSYEIIDPEKSYKFDDYIIEAVEVSHTVPAIGFIVTSPDGKLLIYMGDSGPTRRIWEVVGNRRADVLIIECSFPDAQEALASVSGHLTPHLLEWELEKIAVTPTHVLITHVKPCYRQSIAHELRKIHFPALQILEAGMTIHI